MSIRVLLVDDHRILRLGIRSVLERCEDILIVAEADTGEEALALVDKHRPQVVVIDIGLPGMNGMEATRLILARHPKIRIIALSMHIRRDVIAEMLRNGAVAYLAKECAVHELIDAVKTVIKGGVYLSRKVSAVLGEELSGELRTGNRRPGPLNAVQKQILSLIKEGLETKHIAERLHLSVKTVYKHRQRIMKRLDIHSMAGLVKYAFENSLYLA